MSSMNDMKVSPDDVLSGHVKKPVSGHMKYGQVTDHDSLLKWGQNCNYSKWKDYMMNYLSKNYSRDSDFTTTGAYHIYDPPVPGVAAFDDATDPFGNLKSVFLKGCNIAASNTEHQLDARERMWGDVWLHLSPASKDRVRQKVAEYNQAFQNKDVLALWNLIENVHGNDGAGNDDQNRMILKLKIQNMIQHSTQSLVDFKDALNDAYEAYEKLGGHKTDILERVQEFLRKLYPDRYSDFYSMFSRNVAIGVVKYPTTLQEAVLLASSYQQNVMIDLLQGDNT